jgi:hypothetical protein
VEKSKLVEKVTKLSKSDYVSPKDIDRSSNNNLYTRVKPTRMTRKERNSEEQLSSFLSSDLKSNSRVTLQKFDIKN